MTFVYITPEGEVQYAPSDWLRSSERSLAEAVADPQHAAELVSLLQAGETPAAGSAGHL
jgi:hypothetical protein